ncbi:BatD family protein [Acidisphaera sp. S103]|uniref:BatD family protein n=1 Tax=Acidisphaera sp. S103 TaxID=1747223 RepID=UPI00131AF5A5|nr:BatD family protein [Acidisphaera sp. S103]
MKALFLALIFVLAAANVRSQTAGNVVVRTAMSPTAGAVIGQPIRLLVDVLFRDRMPWPPRVAIGDVAGAQVFRFETQGVTMRDSINGENYVGQRFEFAVYPRRGGTLVVPGAIVTLLDANGDPASSVVGEPTHTEIAIPPGVDASQPVVATDSLTLEEQWSPDPNGLFKAGDALVRTITRSASDIPSLAMRDLAFSAPAGVRVYTDPPVSNDTAERGQVVGHRIDRATYVFETAGQFALPDVTQPWWQLSSGTLQRAIGEGHAVAVAAAPAFAKRWVWNRRALRSPTIWIESAGAIAGMVLLIVAVLRALRWARAVRTERHQRWMRSEVKAFRDLSDACRGADARLIYRAFTVWRDRLPVSARVPAMQLSSELFDTLFVGVAGPWSEPQSQALLMTLRRFREDTLQQTSTSVPSALPPLNPPAIVR